LRHFLDHRLSYIRTDMNAAASLREARLAAGLTQSALARRAGTSQATLSAYESGRKVPSLDTLERLLSAAGARLAIRRPTAPPTEAQLARRGRTLEDVIALAEALPVRHERDLRYPRLPR
jgi:transcriptional regulator with XRE-family HTH domain